MIYKYLMKKSTMYTKKHIVKQTGFTKLTMTGLKTVLFFRRICLCHMVV